MKSIAALPFAFLLAACGDGAGDGLVEAELGGMTVRVEADPARIEVSDAEGRVLFDGLPGSPAPAGRPAHTALAMRTARASYEMRFGAFKIEEPDAGRWRAVAAFGDLRTEDFGIRFELLDAVGEPLGTGMISEAGAGQLEMAFEPASDAHNRMSIAFGCDPDEHFLGLGGQSFDVDHRGFSVPIWVSEDGISKVDTDEYDDLWFLVGRRHSTHTPMPVYLSSRGYALLLQTDLRSIFHLCSEAADVTRLEVWEGKLSLRLFSGPSPSEVLERLTGHLGRPALPPAFAFAPWLDALFGSDNVRRVASKLRDEDVPCSVIWTEDWRGGEEDMLGYALDEDWNVDRRLYPDFEDLASDLHALGFKFLTYNNTFISEGVDIWDEATSNGYTIRNAEGQTYRFTSVTFDDASLLDLTNPDAWEWAKGIYRAGLELGADGYMADFAEWLPTDAVLASGEDARAHHNRYPVEYQRLNRELLDELFASDGVERLFFVRSAYLGSQPLVSVVWAGDQQTDFSVGDGMPSVIPMGIGLGIAGFPYYGHDIGGYMGQVSEPTDKELWFRWVTLGALSPVMRTHHGKNALANWNWESDPDSIAHMRRWARLHIRLFPYLYGLARQASETGLPMLRPMALDHPDFEPGWSLTDQYQLGDRLYVAPVVEQGAFTRTLKLPGGTFYPLLGGEPHSIPPVGGSLTVPAPLTEIPVFVPAGTLLVLLPAQIDTLVAAAPGSDLVTLADVGDDRELWLWPGGDSSWTETSGLSYTWTATTWSGPPTRATWNGQPVDLQDGSLTVTGNGTLEIDGTAFLEVSGGATGRELVIRIR